MFLHRKNFPVYKNNQGPLVENPVFIFYVPLLNLLFSIYYIDFRKLSFHLLKNEFLVLKERREDFLQFLVVFLMDLNFWIFLKRFIRLKNLYYYKWNKILNNSFQSFLYVAFRIPIFSQHLYPSETSNFFKNILRHNLPYIFFIAIANQFKNDFRRTWSFQFYMIIFQII